MGSFLAPGLGSSMKDFGALVAENGKDALIALSQTDQAKRLAEQAKTVTGNITDRIGQVRETITFLWGLRDSGAPRYTGGNDSMTKGSDDSTDVHGGARVFNISDGIARRSVAETSTELEPGGLSSADRGQL